MAGPSLLPLWRHHEMRCCLAPATGEPPFTVAIYKHDQIAVQHAFETHDDAVNFAVSIMRLTIDPRLLKPE